jgi:hypothetical protein
MVELAPSLWREATRHIPQAPLQGRSVEERADTQIMQER